MTHRFVSLTQIIMTKEQLDLLIINLIYFLLSPTTLILIFLILFSSVYENLFCKTYVLYFFSLILETIYFLEINRYNPASQITWCVIFLSQFCVIQNLFLTCSQQRILKKKSC